METTFIDYYQVLEIEFSATAEDIKKAYRRLALKYHPDRNKAANAADKFKEATKAYETLNSSSRRQTYDAAWRKYYSRGSTKTSTSSTDGQRKQQAHQRPHYRGKYAADFVGNPPRNDLQKDVFTAKPFTTEEYIKMGLTWAKWHPKTTFFFLLFLFILFHL